jgi:hypothetical protein
MIDVEKAILRAMAFRSAEVWLAVGTSPRERREGSWRAESNRGPADYEYNAGAHHGEPR